jgi:PncC family amidohydrolase
MSDNPSDIIALAIEKGVTLGCAESLTGGLVASALVDIPGASTVFKGSVVAYDLMVKHDLLGVSAALLAEKGAVNSEVARAMAEGAQAALGVDLAVSTTGVAGPDPDPVSGAKPGLFFVALAGGELGTTEVKFAVPRGARRCWRSMTPWRCGNKPLRPGVGLCNATAITQHS